MDGGLVEREAGRELSEADFGALLSQANEDAHGLLQRFAGARRAM